MMTIKKNITTILVLLITHAVVSQTSIVLYTFSNIGNSNTEFSFTVGESIIFGKDCPAIAAGFNSATGDSLCFWGAKSKQYAKNKMVFYPNPANNEIHIAEKYKSIIIYNSLGIKMAEYKNANIINCATWTAGLYFIEAMTDNNRYLQKIIKQ